MIRLLIALMLFTTPVMAMTAQPYNPTELKCRFDAMDECNLELFNDAGYKIYQAPVEDRIVFNECVEPKYKVCEGL